LSYFQENFKKEHLLIVGFSSKTGMAVAQFLQKQSIPFSVSDHKDSEVVYQNIQKLKITPKNIYAGPQKINQLKGITRVIVSPGVPRNIPLLVEATRLNIPVDSEIALSYAFIKDKNPLLIGITGTDGKSTTAALTHAFFAEKGKTFLLGNFGEPFINKVEEIKKEDTVILELSSYQLEDGEKYHLQGATILNLAPDHLNRYQSMDDYRQAKEKIFINQTGQDLVVLNQESPHFLLWKSLTKAKIKTFSLKESPNKADFYYSQQKNSLFYTQDNHFIPFLPLSHIQLKGSHNLENIMVASAFALHFGVSKEMILNALNNFTGLEHRCEYLGVKKGVHFINDSKATTVQAVIKGLSCASKNLILILGGQDKNLDFSELNPYLGLHVKKIICYGETGLKISQALNFKEKEVVYEFDLAFLKATQSAKKGDTILLSPGCASFDQFESFEHRGNYFKQLVNAL